ncbi:hypothetical protein GOARA_082_00780 [Gordonia araii NBRC 100433]|uniref:DUF1266 domain-containing protein n=2 Tax=Gordonia araii TaxID=263909 RepID=G7H764_9ACTN|nr:DUF1266 domain-containing protein [Gordonia araii NBRC 100433]GAB11689.1 hypothetical protein GOARA_082_00780 [Gordonia araii NBRC 100433]
MLTPIPPTQPFPVGGSSESSRAFRWKGDGTLTSEQQDALNVGAFLWGVNDLWCDSIDVDLPDTQARDTIASAWGITDAVSARMTVGRLLDGMHSSSFEVVAPLVAAVLAKTNGHDPDSHREFLAARTQFRGPSATVADYDALLNLRTMSVLRPVIADSYFPTHIRSWDLGRVGYVVRMSRAAGYLTTDECWPMLLSAAVSARSYYANWRQFAHGLVIGRAYWMALNEMNNAGAAAKAAGERVHGLLMRPDSPWRRYRLGQVDGVSFVKEQPMPEETGSADEASQVPPSGPQPGELGM